MCRGLQLVAPLQIAQDPSLEFRSWREARLLTTVLRSVAAQEQANSIVEVSAAAQQGPQGPHQPQHFVDHSGGRKKQGAVFIAERQAGII